MTDDSQLNPPGLDEPLPLSDDFVAVQLVDPELSPLIDYLQSRVLLSDQDAPHGIIINSQLYTFDGTVLYRVDPKIRQGQVLVVPLSKRQELLEAHQDDLSGGHFGAGRTYSRLRSLYYWPNMVADVRHWCNSCIACAEETSNQEDRSTYDSSPCYPSFDRLAVDIVGPLPQTYNDKKYILVFCDYLTKRPEAFALPDVNADRIARVVVEGIVSRHGAPHQLLSDRGANFLSSIVAEICRLLQY